MTHPANSRTGGQILVDQLVTQGVQHIFCVPGESYLAALDAMHDAPLSVTICRQEAGAAMMAIANARLSDRPGICFVTRSPARPTRPTACGSPSTIPFLDCVRRPGRARHARARRLSGNGLFGFVRIDDQMGDANRGPRAHPGDRPARLSCGDARATRPGRDRAAGGCPDRARRRARRPVGRAGADLAGTDPNGRTAKDAGDRRTTDRDPRRRRLERQRPCGVPAFH